MADEIIGKTQSSRRTHSIASVIEVAQERRVGRCENRPCRKGATPRISSSCSVEPVARLIWRAALSAHSADTTLKWRGASESDSIGANAYSRHVPEKCWYAQLENQLREINVKAHSYALLSLSAVAALALFVARSSGDERPGPYFNAALGGSVAADTKLREFPNAAPGGKVKFDPGVALDLGGGFRFNDWLLVGGQTGFLVNGIKGADADLTQVPILANVELRFP